MGRIRRKYKQDKENDYAVNDAGNWGNRSVFILVAVLAIAPVAGIPPNRGAAIFAIPWPTSSLLLSCFEPFMLSATIADKIDSSPPRSAMTSAAGNSITILSKVSSGN